MNIREQNWILAGTGTVALIAVGLGARIEIPGFHALIALGVVALCVIVNHEYLGAAFSNSHAKSNSNTQAPRRRALVIGAGSVGRSLASNLEATGKYRVIGFLDDDATMLDTADWRLLGGREDASSVVHDFQIDEVFLAHAPTWQETMAAEITDRHPSVKVNIVPSSYEALLRVDRVQNHGDIAVVEMVTNTGWLNRIVKRGFDIVSGIGGLILTAPISLLATILIKMSSPGSIIFKQDRIGLHGSTFTVYKFRTMVADAEAQTGPVLADGRKDARLTPVGRWLRLFRVDEVPQLWNVLKGDMSIVGPRPERPQFVNEFEEVNPSYSLRHRVRPGITGLAQVCGGYHTNWRDKLRFDLIYVSHQSLWLDITILVRTIAVVLFKQGHEKAD